jgi:hypothetical protein
VLEVDADARTATVQQVVLWRDPEPGPSGTLDPDDVRTELREEQSCERSGADTGELDDTHTCQRAGAHEPDCVTPTRG